MTISPPLRPWPPLWTDRLQGWAEGAAFRVDWAREGTRRGTGAVAAGGRLVPDRPVLEHPALIGPDRAGRLLAFSGRAVNHAAMVLAHFNVRWIYHAAWYVSWGNGLWSEGVSGYVSEVGVPGFAVVDVGTSHLVYAAEVLGPLGQLEQNRAEWRFVASPGLEVHAINGSAVAMRGAALADGWWQHGRIQPFVGEGGWLYRPTRWPFEEV